LVIILIVVILVLVALLAALVIVAVLLLLGLALTVVIGSAVKSASDAARTGCRYARFIVVSIAVLVVLVAGTLVVVVLTIVLLVLVVGILALLALTWAVAVVVLGALRMSGHLCEAIRARCRTCGWAVNTSLAAGGAADWLKRLRSEERTSNNGH